MKKVVFNDKINLILHFLKELINPRKKSIKEMMLKNDNDVEYINEDKKKEILHTLSMF